MKNESQRSRGNFELVILGLLFAGRLFVLLAAPATLAGDSIAYLKAAEHIRTEGYLPPLRTQPHALSLLLAPMLAVSGGEIARVVLCLNVAMDSAIVVSLVLMARRLLAPPIAASVRLAACVAIIVQPFTALLSVSVLTEQACQFLLFFGVWSLCRPNSTTDTNRIPVLGPLLLGAAGALRTELLALDLAILLAWFLSKANRGESRKVLLRSIGVALAVYATLPTFMMAYQYSSTKEVGLVRGQSYFPGYLAWMRTWFATEHTQHNRFAFGLGMPEWAGFDMDSYPSRAFDSPEEKDEVHELVEEWRRDGYTDSVNDAFLAVAKEKGKRHRFRQFLWNPLARMGHFWINSEGAQVVLRTIPMKPPLSTVIVGSVLALRIALILLGSCGFVAVWLRRGQFDIPDFQIERVRLGSIALVLRTFMLGILGVFVLGGLMESRYVVIVFPFLIELAVMGTYYLCNCSNRRQGRTSVAAA